MYKVFTGTKSFADPIIGSPLLNKAGLHVLRIALSNLCLRLRRQWISSQGCKTEMRDFGQDGVICLPNFLPDQQFYQLQSDVKAFVEQVDQQYPPIVNCEQGFGKPHKFAEGFDRFDGGTLNRFYQIGHHHGTNCAEFLNNKKLQQLVRLTAGTRFKPNKFWIYRIVHGDEQSHPDIQKVLHKDTFHSAIKLWYFLEDVELSEGPFMYVKGSHKMTLDRYRWEYHRSVTAAQDNKGGAFRVNPNELVAMNLSNPESFPVKANTLIIGDVRGFHCRGQAASMANRLSLYASFRPTPFSPFPV